MAIEESKDGKSVAIIGAGLSGLVALKECLAASLAPTVFEARPEIAGQWAYQAPPTSGSHDDWHPQSSVYEGVILNSSRDTTGFSDYPIDPARHGDYFTHREMHKYILDYAEHFNLSKHIHLNTNVLKCAQIEDGRWRVTFQEEGHLPAERIFDVLVSANGNNTVPLLPQFKDQDKFKGDFLHSHYYRTPGRFEGKRVVLIGSGSAAVDIASELAPGSREVHMITRRGTWIIPRYCLGKPVEAWDSRSTQVWLPPSLADWVQMKLLNLVQGEHPKELKPKNKLMEQNPTIRTEFLERVRTETIKVHRAGVESFTEGGLILSDGTSLEADVIIACTGYRRFQPYLPEDVLRNADTPAYELDLYKFIVPARYTNLYFVGMVETQGPAPPPTEAQARFVVALITGLVAVPTGAELLKRIRDYQVWHAKHYVRSDRHVNTFPYIAYIDSLYEPLGANPTFGRLLGKAFTSGHPLKALSTLSAVYFGLAASAQWRLLGHGAKAELAQATVLRVGDGKLELSEREKEALKREHEKAMEKGV